MSSVVCITLVGNAYHFGSKGVARYSSGDWLDYKELGSAKGERTRQKAGSLAVR